MTNFLWSTWGRRNWTLLAASILLVILEHIAVNHWLGVASDAAFAGAMFCWGASHIDGQYEDCDCDGPAK